MATKKKAPEKAKVKKMARDPAHEMRVAREKKANENPGDVLGGCAPPPLPQADDVSAETLMAKKDLMTGDLVPVPPPQALTLPLVADSATLFFRGAEELTAQLLGQPESARMLANVYEWENKLKKLKKLLVGDEDKLEGLKRHVIEQGQPWGEKGSKQMTLAGVVVKVKAVNWRDIMSSAPLAIADLDEKKVEAYIRGVQWTLPTEKVLACYMKPVTSWTLKDLPPTQQANLQKMLADPGEDGQGLRQCLKETKYQMMTPELENES